MLEAILDPSGATRIVSAAQKASASWRTATMEARLERIAALRRAILRSRKEIVTVICRETGKTQVEALQSDILATLEFLLYLEREARTVLADAATPTPFIFRGDKSHIEYHPYGVVLVIAPWNNPLQLALIPVASALAAGNVVILKPSERTPETGNLIISLCERAGLTGGEVQVITGGVDAAKALIEARPDMIFFTGGTEAGRSVQTAAGRLLIPTVMELGGKDPMIVFADADLDRAARACAYGAFGHAGQHCVSTKRLYVEESAYTNFLERLLMQTRQVTATPEWGSPSDARAQKMAREQVQEALKLGAHLLEPADATQVAAVPTIVADASHSMRLMREETFAPVLGAMPFRAEEEAVTLANDSAYGLNASVWSGSRERCKRVARELQTGNVYVNDVLINIGNPYLPFGGVKSSGIGRYHGAAGLRAFCAEKSVMISRGFGRGSPQWFPHNEEKRRALEDLIELRYGDHGALRRVFGWLGLLRRL